MFREKFVFLFIIYKFFKYNYLFIWGVLFGCFKYVDIVLNCKFLENRVYYIEGYGLNGVVFCN